MTTDEKNADKSPQTESTASGLPSYMTGEPRPGTAEADADAQDREETSPAQPLSHADNDELTQEGKDFFNVLHEQDEELSGQTTAPSPTVQAGSGTHTPEETPNSAPDYEAASMPDEESASASGPASGAWEDFATEDAHEESDTTSSPAGAGFHLGKAVASSASASDAFAVAPDGTAVRQENTENTAQAPETGSMDEQTRDSFSNDTYPPYPPEENADTLGTLHEDEIAGKAKSAEKAAPKGKFGKFGKKSASVKQPGVRSGAPVPARPSFFKSHPVLTVEQTAPPSMSSRLFGLFALSPVLLLTVLFILQNLFTLDSRGLWFADELRYADAFTHLLHQGKELILEVNGTPYTGHSPLYFWGLRGLHWLLPTDSPMLFFVASALSGLLFLWASLGLGRLVGRVDGKTNLAAGIMLLSVFFFLGASHFASMDLLFAALVICSYIFLFMAYAGSGNNVVGMALAFVFAGAATLINGPLGLVLPLCTLVLFALWRGNKDQTRALLLMVLAVGFAVLSLLAGLFLIQKAGYLTDAETLPMEWGLALLGLPALIFLATAALSKNLRFAALGALVVMGATFVLGGGTPYFSWPLVYVLPLAVLGAIAALQITPQRLFRLDFFVGLAIGIVISLLWLGAIYLETGNLDLILNTLLKGELLERSLQGLGDTKSWHHYLPFIPLLLLPWVVVVFFLPYTRVFSQQGRENLAASRRPEKEGLAFLWCVALASLLMLCIFGDRKILHLLPALPALGILCARSILGFTGARARAFQFGMAGLLFLLGIVTIVASLMLFGYLPAPSFTGISWTMAPHGSFFAVAAIFLVAGALIWLGINTARTEGVFLVMALTGLCLAYPLTGKVAASLDPYMNPGRQALTIKAYMDEGYIVSSYNVPEGAYSYYIQKPVPALADLESVTEADNSLFVMPKADADAWSAKPACLEEAQSQWLGNTRYVLLACPAKSDIAPAQSPLVPAPKLLPKLFELAGLEYPFAEEPTPPAQPTQPVSKLPAAPAVATEPSPETAPETAPDTSPDASPDAPPAGQPEQSPADAAAEPADQAAGVPEEVQREETPPAEQPDAASEAASPESSGDASPEASEAPASETAAEPSPVQAPEQAPASDATPASPDEPDAAAPEVVSTPATPAEPAPASDGSGSGPTEQGAEPAPASVPEAAAEPTAEPTSEPSAEQAPEQASSGKESAATAETAAEVPAEAPSEKPGDSATPQQQ